MATAAETATQSATVFNDTQRRTLAALCDTFVPSLVPPPGGGDEFGFWGRSASDLGIPAELEAALASSGMPAEQLDGLRGLLDSLAENGIAADTGQEMREQVVKAFEESGPDALAGIVAFRGLCLTLYYALPDPETGRNPNWEAIGYPGPRAQPPPPGEKPIRLRRPDGDALTLEADVCVVGSGAGGGVITAELAGAGKQVCVVEAGDYYDESDFVQLELWAYEHLFLNGGAFPTAEGQVAVQAGSALGGATVLNWMNCLRTHPWVREEWEREHGLEGLDGAEYEAHLDAVLGRISATDKCSDLNGPHERMREACEKLGYDFRLAVRNTDPDSYDPETAGTLGFGDVSGSKQSTAKTYLEDAHRDGAEVVAGCRVERILVEDGRAAGVEGTRTGEDGRTARVEVRAPVVVVACGSIESPALLVRSGIGGPAVGDNLHLHPTSAVTGVYAEDQRWWWGPAQAAISHEFANLEGGYGFLVECPQPTTGLFAAATPWTSGRDHKERMADWCRAAPFINLTRDRGHGRVTVDAAGRAVPEYRLTDDLDEHNFRRGLAEMIRMHEAAGAQRIIALGRGVPMWERGQDLDRFIAAVGSASLEPRQFGVFSAHQMSTCRMGSDPSTSVADPWGQLHDTPGVWIGDASAFPSASGTNPMVTIMALARRTAGAIAASA